MDSAGSGQEISPGFRVHGKEISRFIKDREFLNQLSE
jgi:hypothetical protein